MDGSALIVIAGGLGVLVVAAALVVGVLYVRSRPPDVRHPSAPQDAGGLARALQSHDPEERQAAAAALGAVPTSDTVEALCAALADPEDRVAAAAALALSQAVPQLRDAALRGQVIAPLAAALRGGRERVSAAAAAALGTAGPGAFEPLVAALGDARGDVVVAAAEALGRLGDARAVPRLVAALQDTRADVAATSVAALRNIGGPAVEPLLPILRSESWVARRHAVVVLGQIGAAEAVPGLLVALRDEQWEVRRAASDALRRIGEPAVAPLMDALTEDDPEQRSVAAGALAELGAPALEPLAAVLRDRRLPREAKQAAAGALEKSGAALTPLQQSWIAVVRSDWRRAVSLGPVAAEPLADALRDRDGRVRRAAAQALDRIGVPPDTATQAWHAAGLGDWERAVWLGSAALEPLLALAQDDDPDVRLGAVTSLGRAGADLEDGVQRAQVVQALLAARNDRSAPVSQAASDSLGRVGAHSVEPLIAILTDRTTDPAAREAAAGALGRAGNERAVAPLISAVRSDRWRVRIAAAEALGTIGAPAVKQLARALADDRWTLRWAATRALGVARFDRAVGALAHVLKDEEKYVRWAAAEALAACGAPPDPASEAWYAVARRDWPRAVELGTVAVAPLVAALRDPDREARAAAADALNRIGAPAVGPLVEALYDPSPEVRASAAAALGQSGAVHAVDPLLAALSDVSAEVRAVAARSLGQIGDGRAVNALIAALQDRDFAVRRAATEALGAIGDAAVGPLLAVLTNSSADARWVIAAALGQTGDVRAVDALLVALQDGRAAVRQSAVEALGALREARLGDALLEALKDADVGVRSTAAAAVVYLGGAAARPLMDLLSDGTPRVRSAAAESLGWICAGTRDAELRAGAAGMLGAALLHDEDARARRVAAEALGKIGVPAVELLAASLEDHDREVRRAAARALDQVGLPGDVDTQARYAVMRGDWARAAALGAGGVAAVLAAVDDEETLMRQAAAQALAEIGTAAVVPLLAALAAGSALAADALGQIGDLRAVEPLLAALRNSPGPRLRQAAEGALARLSRQAGLDDAVRQRIADAAR